MSIDIASIENLLISHALGTGRFVEVNGHESKQSPSNGITAGIWVSRIDPIKSSGLDKVSIRLEFTIRLYANSSSQPYDDIDPELIYALDDLMTAYVGDFELGNNSRMIDIFGSQGAGVTSRVGYINQDGREFRVHNITLPILINDVWVETA